jgi:hypothetical protein
MELSAVPMPSFPEFAQVSIRINMGEREFEDSVKEHSSRKLGDVPLKIFSPPSMQENQFL